MPTFLAAPRHDENATGSRPAGCAPASCSPPGVRHAEVARQLGVSAQAVSSWHRRWQTGGMQALRSRGPSGPAPRLSDAQLATVEQALLDGATANAFTGELWTLDRIALVIWRLTGIRHHPAHVWALLHHRLGWTVQRPRRAQPWSCSPSTSPVSKASAAMVCYLVRLVVMWRWGASGRGSAAVRPGRRHQRGSRCDRRGE